MTPKTPAKPLPNTPADARPNTPADARPNTPADALPNTPADAPADALVDSPGSISPIAGRWRRLGASALPDLRRDPVDAKTLGEAAAIIAQVRGGGEGAVRRLGERFGDIRTGAALVLDRAAMARQLDALPGPEQALLRRTAERIETFARAQRDSLKPMEIGIPGGRAGHTIAPVARAGCYAPGGRFPLPSSVLMTVITARVAGVSEVWVASPKPTTMTIAAAAVAGADALLCVGGAQAIAAMAYGAGQIPACDIIVGPGNRWVTAAKQLVSGRVGIDMLAGPSELVVLADLAANPAVVAADLLGQAEHDTDAVPILVVIAAAGVEGVAFVDRVEAELDRQLSSLPTAQTARRALDNGFAVISRGLDEAVGICDQLAPEHLELELQDAQAVAHRFGHYGGLFIGAHAAEVLGDYGAGPNHVLPTGGTARFVGGLSVLTFLRVRTYLSIDVPSEAQALVGDAIALARHEGLEAHARSAAHRKQTPSE